MSIVLWDEDKYLECPHCKKIIRIGTQESGYGFCVYTTNQDNIPKGKELKDNMI